MKACSTASCVMRVHSSITGDSLLCTCGSGQYILLPGTKVRPCVAHLLMQPVRVFDTWYWVGHPLHCCWNSNDLLDGITQPFPVVVPVKDVPDIWNLIRISWSDRREHVDNQPAYTGLCTGLWYRLQLYVSAEATKQHNTSAPPHMHIATVSAILSVLLADKQTDSSRRMQDYRCSQHSPLPMSPHHFLSHTRATGGSASKIEQGMARSLVGWFSGLLAMMY